jgi:hypothetical protein
VLSTRLRGCWYSGHDGTVFGETISNLAHWRTQLLRASRPLASRQWACQRATARHVGDAGSPIIDFDNAPKTLCCSKQPRATF